MSCDVDSWERRDVASMDLPGAFLQSLLTQTSQRKQHEGGYNVSEREFIRADGYGETNFIS